MEVVWERGRNVIQETLELAKAGQVERALDLLDGVLNEAIQENRATWVSLLCKHGAVLALSMGERARQIGYEEMALPYTRDDPFAVYNLANLLLSDGQTARAERCAAEAYRLCRSSETQDERNLLTAILRQWPGIGESQ